MKASERHASGFTIVELVIVVVVIAILATIGTFAYNGVARGAKESSIKSELQDAASQITRLQLRTGAYPSDISTIQGNNSDITYEYKVTASGYCLSATSSDQNLDSFRITGDRAVEKGRCTGIATVIAAGKTATCAIGSDRAYCWGRNSTGQLGDGTTTQRTTPVAVSTSGVLAGKTVTRIATGVSHACAVADGAAYCWGQNNTGQLGDGTTTQRTTPVAVSTSGVLAGKIVSDISVGTRYSCAIANSKAYCWGENTYGQLGDGTTTQRTTPVAVSESGVLSGKVVTSLSLGLDGSSSCAIANGLAYCWGNGGTGIMGNGTLTSINSLPTPVNTSGILSGKTVTSISVGSSHACAVAGGVAACWGLNTYGQLGNGTQTQQTTPVAVSASGTLSGKTVASISAGSASTCALAEKTAYCWGLNSWGQIGNGLTANGGNTVYNTVPAAVSVSDALKNKPIDSISSGTEYTCAIAVSSVYCWGINIAGELGIGTTALSNTLPIATSPFPEV